MAWRFSFPPPAIPGIGTSGGVTMILRGSLRERRSDFLTKNLFAFSGRALKAPGDCGRHSVVSARRAAALRRCGSRKGAAAAGQTLTNIYTTHADLHGRLSGELLQPLWPPVADLCGSGREHAHAISTTSTSSMCAAPTAARFRWLAGDTSSRSPGRSSSIASTNSTPRRSTSPARRATVPAR